MEKNDVLKSYALKIKDFKNTSLSREMHIYNMEYRKGRTLA